MLKTLYRAISIIPWNFDEGQDDVTAEFLKWDKFLALQPR